MNGSIITLGVVVLVATGTFMGLFTFMYEMDRSGYAHIEPPAGTDDTTEEIIQDMEETSEQLKGHLTGQGSWLQTAYSIFFTMPNNVMVSLSAISNSASKMMSLGTGTANPLPIPAWATSIMYIAIMLLIVSALIYLALGRRA